MEGGNTEPLIVERERPFIFFVNGIQQIDRLAGGNLLFTFFREQTALDESRAPEHEVELKIVAHADDVMRMIRDAMDALKAPEHSEACMTPALAN